MERIYYSIKEVSERVGEPFSTLRYWEQEIPQLRPHRNEGKTRFYTPEDVQLIEQIKYLREDQKLTIKAIKHRLNVDKQGVESRQKIAGLLKQIRQELVDIQSNI